MKRIYSILIIFFFLASCEREPKPQIEPQVKPPVKELNAYKLGEKIERIHDGFIILKYVKIDCQRNDCAPSCCTYQFTDGKVLYNFNFSSLFQRMNVWQKLVEGEKYVIGYKTSEKHVTKSSIEWNECKDGECASCITYINSLEDELKGENLFLFEPDPYDGYKAADFQEKLLTGELNVLFHGVTTEPFLDIYILNDYVLISEMEEIPAVYKTKDLFVSTLEEQTIHFNNLEVDRRIIIEKKLGSDGMSERIYPYSIVLDEELYGGGDSKLMKFEDQDPE